MQPRIAHPARRFLGLALLAIVIVGCVPLKPELAIPTLTPRALTSADATMTPAPNCLPAATATPSIAIASECIPIEDQTPSDLSLAGVWLQNQNIPYLETLDGRTDYRLPLQGQGIFSLDPGDAAVSPNQEYLAYIDKYVDPVTKYRLDKRILRIIAS